MYIVIDPVNKNKNFFPLNLFFISERVTMMIFFKFFILFLSSPRFINVCCKILVPVVKYPLSSGQLNCVLLLPLIGGGAYCDLVTGQLDSGWWLKCCN